MSDCSLESGRFLAVKPPCLSLRVERDNGIKDFQKVSKNFLEKGATNI